ncbi:MAG: dTMP kinase [Saprospiraceae bacterium]|nr:dTMP kinase [Saprospiraceae bacterium]
MKDNKGKFIVFEGIDGSGKSTQAKLLAEFLNSMNLKNHLTSEPTKRPVGKMIRQIFSEELTMDNLVVAGLFVADRLDHLTNSEDGILHFINQGKHVISDRYYLSSYAYQGTFAPMNWIIESNQMARTLLKADITFYLDLNPYESMKRIQAQRESKEIYENLEILKKVHANYQEVIRIFRSDENIVVLDANLPSDELSNIICNKVIQILN